MADTSEFLSIAKMVKRSEIWLKLAYISNLIKITPRVKAGRIRKHPKSHPFRLKGSQQRYVEHTTLSILHIYQNTLYSVINNSSFILVFPEPITPTQIKHILIIVTA